MDYHVRYTPTAALSLRPYFLRIYARFFGLTKTQTTAFHPQSDGLVERFNRTIKDMLSKAVRRDQRNWDDIFCRSRTNAIWLDASLLILSSLSDNVTTYSVWVHGSYFGGSPYKRSTGSSASQPIIIRYPHAQRALIMAKCHPNFVGRGSTSFYRRIYISVWITTSDTHRPRLSVYVLTFTKHHHTRSKSDTLMLRGTVR
jgi:hypothetical protein